MVIRTLISDWLKERNTRVEYHKFSDPNNPRIKINEYHFYKDNQYIKKTIEIYKRNKLISINTI